LAAGQARKTHCKLPGPTGELQRSSRPISWINGSLLLRGGNGREGEGEGKEGEGEGKRKVKGPDTDTGTSSLASNDTLTTVILTRTQLARSRPQFSRPRSKTTSSNSARIGDRM